MRRSTVLALAAAALVTACSYQPFIGGNPSTDPDSPVGNSSGTDEPMPTGDGALSETPDPNIVDAHPTGISHFVIAPDGRTVTVYYWGGNQTCFGLQKVEVAGATDGPPTITVWEGTRPAAVGQACTMEALLKKLVVTLNTAVVVDTAQPNGASSEAEIAPEPEIVEVEGVVLDPVQVAITGFHVSGDGLTLTAHFYGGVPECYGLADATVDATARPATVSVREGRKPGAEVCIEIALAKAVVFTLDAPLIVDGSLAAAS